MRIGSDKGGMVEHKKTVLIIDDEKIILLGTSAIMRHAGFDVLTASTGIDGLSLVHQHHPDLIICDVMMPPPDGFELRRIISEDPETSEIPFIFVTARSAQEDKLFGFEAGADDYITKPFDRAELLARVNAVFRRNEISRNRGREEVKLEMEKLRAEIMNNVSHELRTPMGVMLSSLELTLQNKFNNPEDEKGFINRALINAYQLRSLIEDLIVLTNIDQDTLNTFRQHIDPEFDIRLQAQKCIERYPDKHLNLVLEISPDIAIHAPRQEFRHALTHLMDNACKFSYENGEISLKVTSNGAGGCILTVQDQGIGIPPEIREKVFERYFQASHGDTRIYRGLGVGLVITRAIARSLGGDVTILDDNSGTCVQMIIAPANLDWRE